MNVVILNGIAAPDRPDLEGQLAAFRREAEAGGAAVAEFVLRHLDIRDCVGCFQCWVRTPGTCVHRDDMAGILREVVGADRLVYATDVHLFHISAPLKGFLDRVIPLARAYLTIGSNGRMAHLPRYDLRFRTLLLVENQPGLDEGDLRAMAASCGGNGHGFNGVFPLDHPVQELCHALVGH